MAFSAVSASPIEIAAPRAGDELVPDADVVMDRAFDLGATPQVVWPWIVQLGKGRAGWYLPRSAERFLPTSRRAIRHIDSRWQNLKVGQTIPDYGGSHATFTAETVDAPTALVYSSQRGRMRMSWSITLTGSDSHTRMHLRLRLGPVRRKWLAESVGDLFDALTILGMAAGLRERVAAPPPAPHAAFREGGPA